MPELLGRLTLSTQLFLPALLSGVLLIACFVTFYLYWQTREKVYWPSTLFLFFSAIFTGAEGAILLVGSMQRNRALSLEIHRIEQLAATLLLFAIPYMLYAALPTLYPRMTKLLVRIGFTFSAVAIVCSYLYPPSFVDMSMDFPADAIHITRYGRGQEGFVYAMRDIWILVLCGYSFYFFSIACKKSSEKRLLQWYRTGLEIAFVMSIADVINVHWRYKDNLLPLLDFSYAALGFAIFGILILFGVLERYLRKLYERESSLKRVQRLAHVGGIEWNRETNLVSLSDEFLRSFGVPTGDRELLLSEFLSRYTTDEGTSYLTNSLEKALTGEAVEPFVSQVLSENGDRAWAHFTAPEIIEQSKGRVVRLLWSVQDVTALREVEDQLFQSQKMDAIGQLAGGVAHDFNNTLSGILGSAELLQLETEENSEAQELIETIIDSTQKAGDLTRQLLDFSRKGVREYKPVDIHSTLRDCIELLSHSINKKVEVKKSLCANSKIVLGDVSQLQNSFLNLGINAGHAMAEGGTLIYETAVVSLDAEYCRISQFSIKPGDFIRVSIEDTGTGIAPENLEKIFEPFFTTKQKGIGTGLGLSSVLAIISQHGGEIKVSSTLGEGTTFTIHLPLQQIRFVEEEKAEKMEQGSGCILVVDDEPVVRLTLIAILKKMGYDTLAASTGEEALALFTEKHASIDAILLDMLMPDMDGIECFHRLKEIDENAKVVLNSGYSQSESREKNLNLGFEAVLYKPLGAAALSRTLTKVLV